MLYRRSAAGTAEHSLRGTRTYRKASARWVLTNPAIRSAELRTSSVKRASPSRAAKGAIEAAQFIAHTLLACDREHRTQQHQGNHESNVEPALGRLRPHEQRDRKQKRERRPETVLISWRVSRGPRDERPALFGSGGTGNERCRTRPRPY